MLQVFASKIAIKKATGIQWLFHDEKHL